MKLRRKPLEVEALTVAEAVAYTRVVERNEYVDESLKDPVPAVPGWFAEALAGDKIQILPLAGRVWVRSDKHGSVRAYAVDVIARDHKGELFVIDSNELDDMFDQIG